MRAYAADENKIYYVPPKVIASVIENSKGSRRALFIWMSSDSASRKALQDYADLEKALPGSVIAVSIDKNYGILSSFLRTIKKLPFKVLLSKPTDGQSFDTFLKKLGAKPTERYPLIILLDEENQIAQQGTIYIDNVADYLFSKK